MQAADKVDPNCNERRQRAGLEEVQRCTAAIAYKGLHVKFGCPKHLVLQSFRFY